MRAWRLAAVVVLATLLATSVAAGNAAVAAERTVLSAPFVGAALDETDAYGTVIDVVLEGAAAGEEGGPDGPVAGATREVAEAALTEEYVRGETEANLDRVYGYLHGDRAAVAVAVDLAPVQANLTAVLEARIRNASTGELLDAVGLHDGTVTVGGAELDPAVLAEMDRNRTAYRAARAEFRADLRAATVESLADEAYAAATDDQRLALVVADYDPESYTDAEKQAMVDERESEIRAALAARVERERADEVDRLVDEQRSALAALEGDDVAPAVNASADGLQPSLLPPVADLVDVSAEALATDVPYDVYRSETDAAKARLAANASALLAGEMEGSERYVVADSRDPEAGQGLRTARTAVRAIDGLAVALPLVAAGLVGALWWLTRSPPLTAGATGASLLVGGLPGFVLAEVAVGQLEAALAGAGAPVAASGLLVALADRVLGVLAAQSLAVAAAGVGLLALAGYLHAVGAPEWAGGGRVREV